MAEAGASYPSQVQIQEPTTDNNQDSKGIEEKVDILHQEKHQHVRTFEPSCHHVCVPSCLPVAQVNLPNLATHTAKAVNPREGMAAIQQKMLRCSADVLQRSCSSRTAQGAMEAHCLKAALLVLWELREQPFFVLP